jgi:hypothetical protein
MMSGLVGIAAAAVISATAVQVHVTSEWTKGPCVSQSLRFEILPPEGYKVNQEGPWKLELDGAVVPGKPDFTKTPPAFIVDSRCGVRDGIKHVSYKITAFVCKADGSECLRQIITGDL